MSLDTSFGIGGKVVNSFSTGDDILVSIKLLEDGKILGCYVVPNDNSGNIHLVRFNIDGTIDTAFGINGLVHTLLFTETYTSSKLTIQNNGKILVVGDSGNSFSNFGVGRFNSDGSIDTTFGDNGYSFISFSNYSENGIAVCIQNDEKILIAGRIVSNFNPYDIAVVRLLSNGDIDISFGINGKFTMNVGSNNSQSSNGLSRDCIFTVKENNLGEIYLGGTTNANEISYNRDNFLFVCLNPNGTLKSSFGTNGVLMVDFGSDDELLDLELSNDSIYAAGASQTQSGLFKMALVKILADGSLDNSFGVNGKVLTNSSQNNQFDHVADFIIQNDGKLLCVGVTLESLNQYNANPLLISFDENGIINSSFNNVGYVNTDLSGFDDSFYLLVILQDGKIIGAGKTKNVGSIDDTVLVKFNQTNLLNSEFSKPQFSVSPNPFTTSINLTFSFSQNQKLTIDLVDANGRMIQNLGKEKIVAFENNSLHLDLPETLSKGIYFLNIYDGYQTQVIKVMK